MTIFCFVYVFFKSVFWKSNVAFSDPGPAPSLSDKAVCYLYLKRATRVLDQRSWTQLHVLVVTATTFLKPEIFLSSTKRSDDSGRGPAFLPGRQTNRKDSFVLVNFQRAVEVNKFPLLTREIKSFTLASLQCKPRSGAFPLPVVLRPQLCTGPQNTFCFGNSRPCKTQ